MAVLRVGKWCGCPPNDTMSQRLIFYSPLHARPWGSLHFMFLIFLAAGLIAALCKRASLHVLACLGILPIAAVFLAPLVLAHTSVVSFSAPFLGTIMGGTLIFLCIFVAHTPRWGALVAIIIVLALALPSVLPLTPPHDLIGKPVSRRELEHYKFINDDIVEKITDWETSARPEVVFTFDHDFLPYPNLSIRYFQGTGGFLSMYRIDDLGDPDAASLLEHADFIITITPIGEARTVPNLLVKLPTSADPALADARVRESGRYGVIASYQVQGGQIWLYHAKAPR
jgi:hypothetical protein